MEVHIKALGIIHLVMGALAGLSALAVGLLFFGVGAVGGVAATTRSVTRAEVARCLGMSIRGARWALRREVDPDLIRAVDLQLGLRTSWNAFKSARRGGVGNQPG